MAVIPMTRTGTVAPGNRWAAAAAIIGGVAVIVGSSLPWLSTLAGLRTLTGLDGINGRVLAAGGVIVVALGLVSLRRGSPLLIRATALAGFVLLALSSWLLLALWSTYRELAATPFALARMGPGLFIATAGAAVAFSPLLRPTARVPEEDPGEQSRTDVVTVIIAACSVLAGVLHLALSGEHWSDSTGTAAAFTAVGLLQITLAAPLVLRRMRPLVLAGVAVNAGAIVAWALAESGLLTGFHGGGHHGQGILVATLAAEAVVVIGGLAIHRRF